MGKQAELAKVVDYFVTEEHRLLGRIGQLADEQRQLQLQLDDIRQLRANLGDTTDVNVVPKAAGAKRKAATPAPVRKARGKRQAGRKGRRKSTKTAANDINSMSIVDAAIHFAKEHNQPVVDAGQILDWFEEAGYQTRNGTPNRNSIYVSLNRERHEGEKSGVLRVEHVERGKFRFPEV